MIPASTSQVAVTSGALDSLSFDISPGDSAHLMEILRDTLYSDKILAVLREYASNAWDANRMVGKHDVPIHVTLPESRAGGDGRFLIIRDHGPGLSPDDMRYFVLYGASTKRESDDVVGTMGIGCKVGFSYADSFEVTSYHNGIKRSYIAAMDQSNKGQLNLLDETPTDETGLEIRIAVKPEDVWAFREKAQSLLRFFRPQPVTNVPLTDPTDGQKIGVFPSGMLSNNPGWTAVMGCVPYRLDMSQVKGIPDFMLNQTGGILYFDIGEVQVAASREELKYGDKTNQAVVRRVDELLTDFTKWVETEIVNGPGTIWDKRWSLVSSSQLVPTIRQLPFVQSFFQKRFDLPEDLPFQVFVPETSSRGSYYRRRSSHSRTVLAERAYFTVDAGTEFVAVQQQAQYVQYVRRENHVVFVPKDPTVDVNVMLATFLEENKLTGAPVLTVEQLKQRYPRPQAERASPTRLGRTFRIPDGKSYGKRSWEQSDIPTDVPVMIVPINRFENHDLHQLKRYREACSLVGITCPPIHGVKRGFYDEQKIKAKYPLSMTWDEWSSNVKATLQSSAVVRDAVKSMLLVNVLSKALDDVSEDAQEALQKALPKGHALRALLRSASEEDQTTYTCVSYVLDLPKYDASSTDVLKEYPEVAEAIEVLKHYPLLQPVLASIRWATKEKLKNTMTSIIDYIMMVDERSGK